MNLYFLSFVALLTFFLGGCQEREVGSQISANREVRSQISTELDVWLSDFEDSISTKVGNEVHSDTLFTERGVFAVSTQPGTADDEGVISFAGDSRTHGYFIAPRMFWVDSIHEAKKLILEDWEAGKGLPLEDYTSNVESASH